MSARLILPLVAAWLAGMPSLASAYSARQTGCPGYYGDDDGNTARVLRPGLSLESWTKPCPDEKCRAIRDISCAVNAQAHRLQPNTMAYYTPRDAERAKDQYGLNIWSLGREHPRRIPLYCRLLARVASTLTGDKEQDGRTADNVIELAVVLNRPHHHCLADVMSAVPAPAATQMETSWGWACLRKIRRCQRWIDREYGPRRAAARRSAG